MNSHYLLAAARSLVCLLAALLLSAGPVSASDDFDIGVFYFPGWKDNQPGASYPLPWEPIKPFPAREPVLGWYREGELDVMSRHLGWMKDYEIDFVVFDWFWGSDNRPYLDHALNAYLSLRDKEGVDFALLWANHTAYRFSLVQLEAMFRFWAQRYFFREEYRRVEGKPVVFVFSAQTLNDNAVAAGMSPAQLMQWADEVVRSEGLEGVRFVGGVSGALQGFDYSAGSGYSAFAAYNFHGRASGPYAGGHLHSHSYAELDAGYRDQWRWMLEYADNMFVVPMTAGWDRRPWGGSTDPLHDLSRGTASEFEAHLTAARSVMLSARDRTRLTGVICCWNEFGEGSFIEPTKRAGFSYLEKIRNVFGRSVDD